MDQEVNQLVLKGEAYYDAQEKSKSQTFLNPSLKESSENVKIIMNPFNNIKYNLSFVKNDSIASNNVPVTKKIKNMSENKKELIFIKESLDLEQKNIDYFYYHENYIKNFNGLILLAILTIKNYFIRAPPLLEFSNIDHKNFISIFKSERFQLKLMEWLEIKNLSFYENLFNFSEQSDCLKDFKNSKLLQSLQNLILNLDIRSKAKNEEIESKFIKSVIAEMYRLIMEFFDLEPSFDLTHNILSALLIFPESIHHIFGIKVDVFLKILKKKEKKSLKNLLEKTLSFLKFTQPNEGNEINVSVNGQENLVFTILTLIFQISYVKSINWIVGKCKLNDVISENLSRTEPLLINSPSEKSKKKKLREKALEIERDPLESERKRLKNIEEKLKIERKKLQEWENELRLKNENIERQKIKIMEQIENQSIVKNEIRKNYQEKEEGLKEIAELKRQINNNKDDFKRKIMEILELIQGLIHNQKEYYNLDISNCGFLNIEREIIIEVEKCRKIFIKHYQKFEDMKREIRNLKLTISTLEKILSKKEVQSYFIGVKLRSRNIDLSEKKTDKKEKPSKSKSFFQKLITITGKWTNKRGINDELQ